MEIKVIKGDITEMGVDAIVNAANKELRWGSGVCGAIFNKAGGYKLQEECDKLSPIKTGEAVITNGYNLKAKYIIHAAGPVYMDNNEDARLLTNAYKNSLDLAEKYKLKSIAFPSISTGVYGYPVEEASTIAINTVKNYVAKSVELVIFVCFDDYTYHLYLRNMKKEA